MECPKDTLSDYNVKNLDYIKNNNIYTQDNQERYIYKVDVGSTFGFSLDTSK